MKKCLVVCLMALCVVCVAVPSAAAATKVGPSVTTLSSGTVQGSAWWVNYGGDHSWVQMGVKNNNIAASRLVYVHIYDSVAGASVYMYGKSVTNGQVKTWTEPTGNYVSSLDGYVRTRCDGVWGVKKAF